MSKNRLLFISNQSFLDPDIPGGVQICTQEYVDLLKACGYDLDMLPVSPRNDVPFRIRTQIFSDPYSCFDLPAIASKAAEHITENDISDVALNQVNLLPIGRMLKERLSQDLTVISLSHGNESGDRVHKILRRSDGWADQAMGALELGWMLLQEARLFTEVADFMLCMSDIEQKIDAWLGADQSMVVPRTFTPDFLDWSPVPGRVGFVGALSHLPNEEGIRRVLAALEHRGRETDTSVEVRIVGGPATAGRELERTFSAATYCGRLSEEEFRKEAATWALFVNPIWWYARGASTKLTKAVNWGIPVVTTTPGMRGYTWSDGSVQVADSPQEMAELLLSTAWDLDRLNDFADEVRTVAHNGPSLADLAEKMSRHLNNLH